MTPAETITEAESEIITGSITTIVISVTSVEMTEIVTSIIFHNNTNNVK